MSKKRRGKSLEEKRAIVQKILIDTQRVFKLPDLEKSASKKGVTKQSVKEVVQSLVDDNFIQSDKIGSGNFFWCFPSQNYNQKKLEHQKLADEIKKLEDENKHFEEQIKILKPERELTKERETLSNELEELEAQNNKLDEDIELYESLDLETCMSMKESIRISKESVNRWTDNIYQTISYCKKKFNIQEDQLRKGFGISQDIDYYD
ncbi:meiotic nuclear division protein [Anaeramoeba flamelloides]|uniref:Meiotic nuclear division protein n=1 Tax=Anaeramoeba flamelloides TaxID=1746091 RepID=A0ABQ8Z1I3_9EUKA|nr:meiotic nuclear division protein [Anaeramoeba flamelloides]